MRPLYIYLLVYDYKNQPSMSEKITNPTTPLDPMSTGFMEGDLIINKGILEVEITYHGLTIAEVIEVNLA